MGKFNSLFQPLEVRRCTIPNRIVMTPMGTNFAENTGEMSFLHIDYYEQRAQGGAGLIIVENACVDYPAGSNGTTQLRLDLDSYIPRMFKLTETIHKHDTKIAVQLNHAGASAVAERINMQPVSASNLPNKKGGATPRPLTVKEINSIVESYAKAAKRAQIAGFDAVEIHCGHSYLISQFLSPLTNNRTDEFGGSYENRARFATMILKAVREAVGPFFPILIRISADEFLPGGNTLEDTLKLLEYFQEEADIIDVSCGLVDSIQYQIDANYLKDGWRTYLATAVKEKFNKPVITVGNIRDPKVANEIIESNQADFIGLGRQFVADPQWPLKVKEGRLDEVRKCISCNIGCSGHRIGLNRPIRCTINPSVNEGEAYKNQKVKKPCNVVVIGGGTAGLEAACTAAEVGCMTFLIEKEDHLGGTMGDICTAQFKSNIKKLTEWYKVQLSKLPVDIHLNTTITGEEDILKTCDAIIVSTGATPFTPSIPGIDGKNVVNIVEAHRNESLIKGDKIVICGGGASGLDGAIEIAEEMHKDVTVVEMLPEMGKDVFFINKISLFNKLAENNVKLMTNTKVTAIDETGLTVEENGIEKHISEGKIV